MGLSLPPWGRLFRKRASRPARPQTRATYRPRLDALEERLVPAVDVWTGAGANNNWSTPANWAAGFAPVNNDDLVFPAGAAQTNLTDDLGATGAATTFHSITFTGSNYTLNSSKNRTLKLTGGIVANEPTDSGTVTNTLNIPVALSAPQTFVSLYPGAILAFSSTVNLNGNALTLDGSGTTAFNGQLIGAGGLTKNGAGTLNLNPPFNTPNTYSGLTTLNAGVTVISQSGSLGATGAGNGTVVNSGASLETSPASIITVAEDIQLNGNGVGGAPVGNNNNLGALEETTGFLTLTGNISLGSDAALGTIFTGNLTINSNSVALNGHTLTLENSGSITVNAPITNGPAGSASGSLVINPGLTGAASPQGTVTLTATNSYTGSTTVVGGVLNLSANGTLNSTDIRLVGNIAQGSGPGGVLQLDNTNGVRTNRLPTSATLTMTGGGLAINAADPAGLQQTLGAIHLARGESFIRTSNSLGGVPRLISLQVGSLVRDPGSTLELDSAGSAPGSSTNLIRFSTPPTTVGNNGGILPYVTISGTDYATYSIANGIAAFTGYQTNFANAGPGDIVKLTANATLAANKTVTGLLLSGSTLTINPGATLTVANGLLTTGSATVQPGSGSGSDPTLAFTNEGVVLADGSTNLNTVIAGTNGLTLSGTSSVTITPPGTGNGNNYTGGTTLASGTVVIGGTNNPFGVGPVTVTDGSPQASVFVGSYTINNAVTFNNASVPFTGISNLTFAGPVTLTGTNRFSVSLVTKVILSGKVSGTGGFILAGDNGSLTITNPANNYSGGTAEVNDGIFQPILIVGAGGGTPLGTGPITLVNGTFEASAAQVLPNSVVLPSSSSAFSGALVLGGTSPNDQAITFSGPVTVVGASALQAPSSPSTVPITFTGPVSGSGTLSTSGLITMSGANTLAGATEAAAQSLAVGSAPTSGPVEASGATSTLAATGSVGYVAAGNLGTVLAGGPAPGVGILSAPGANFSNSNGTLELAITGYGRAGVDFDQLNLGTGTLVLGGTSQLVVDLRGLTTGGVAQGAILYGTLLGNQRFSQVSTINNPSGLAITVDYQATAINIIVGPITHTPLVNLPGPGAQTTAENTPLVFSNANNNPVSIFDYAASITNQAVSATLSVTNGTLTLASTAGLTFTAGANGSATMTVRGTVAAINAALAGLKYSPTLTYAGPAQFTLSVTDPLGGASGTTTGKVNITVVADVPTVAVPLTTQGTTENVPLVFSAANANAITTADADATFNPVQVALGVTAGTLSLPVTTGLTVTGNGTAALTVVGPLPLVNARLDGLAYTPGDDYVGPDTLGVVVTDLGTGPGNPQSSSASVSLTVLAGPHQPSFTAGPNLTVADDSGPQTVTGWATNILAKPPNVNATARLSFSTANDNTGLFTAQPAVDRFGNLTFTPKVNTSGTAHVTVTLKQTDPGNVIDTFAQTFTITVKNVGIPAVTDVIVHWGTQSASLLTILASGRTILPFLNINAVDVVFNENVSVNQGDLALSGLSNGSYGVSGFHYNKTTFTATWTLATPLGGSSGIEKLLNLTLDGSDANGIHNGKGQFLGNGSDYVLNSFQVLVGDVNGDGVVDLKDQLAVARSLSIRYTGINYADIDGNGAVDMLDYNLVTARKNHNLTT